MEHAIVVALIGYILLLHFQFNKKNILIKTMADRLRLVEKEFGSGQVLDQLEKFRLLRAESNVKRDKLFEESVMKFLFANEKDSKIFVHYTKDEDIARRIFEEGFLFVDSFEKTTEQIINDSIDLTYKHNIRKYYGKYIVVISISNEIYNHYDIELKLLNKQNAQVEHFLTDIPSYFNDNMDEVFTLSRHFIKGYVNYETGAIIYNPEFNPTYTAHLV